MERHLPPPHKTPNLNPIPPWPRLPRPAYPTPPYPPPPSPSSPALRALFQLFSDVLPWSGSFPVPPWGAYSASLSQPKLHSILNMGGNIT